MINERYYAVKVNSKDDNNKPVKVDIIVNNLKRAREIAANHYRDDSFISLRNKKGVLLPI